MQRITYVNNSLLGEDNINENQQINLIILYFSICTQF